MNILTHCWELIEGQEIIQGGLIKQKVAINETRYIDFIVSGFKLSELLDIKKHRMISIFGWGNLDYNIQRIIEVSKMIEPELASGRSIIYGCPHCGDIGCGAITVEIIDTGDKISWSNFGYENGYDEIEFNTFGSLTPFEFNKEEYLNELLNIQNEIITELKG